MKTTADFKPTILKVTFLKFIGKNKREFQVAALMGLSAFFTLIGYEFIRSASTVLFKTAYGADKLPVVLAIMPLVVFGGVAGYGRLLSMLGPRQTLRVTTLGAGLVIFLCYLAIIGGSEIATGILYIVKEFYIVLLIEQYWSYINSSLQTDTARRLNGPITGVAGLGGAIGGILVSQYAVSLGTESLLLVAAVSVIPALCVSEIAYHLNGEPAAPKRQSSHMGWSLFRGSRILRYLLAIVVSSQIVSAVLDLKFQELLSIRFADQMNEETAFQGWFFGTLNSSVLVLQFIVAPVLLSLFSLRLIHILMPMIHLGAITVAIIEPTVFTVGLAFFLFKAFDYSVFRAAKEIVYIPLSYDTRYRAKEVIDVFGYRTGKGGSSVVIVLLQRAGILMGNYYTWIAFTAAALWLTLIFPLTHDVEEHLQSQDVAKQEEPDQD
jgi:AAA family ATP:ADP antiporter